MVTCLHYYTLTLVQSLAWTWFAPTTAAYRPTSTTTRTGAENSDLHDGNMTTRIEMSDNRLHGLDRLQ